MELVLASQVVALAVNQWASGIRALWERLVPVLSVQFGDIFKSADDIDNIEYVFEAIQDLLKYRCIQVVATSPHSLLFVVINDVGKN